MFEELSKYYSNIPNLKGVEIEKESQGLVKKRASVDAWRRSWA
jgi:hypothetical protein